MTWRQVIRSMEADARRRQRKQAADEREAMRRYRDLERRQREMAKQDEKLRLAHEVEQFENYLDLLVSVHKDGGERWDWRSIAREPAPTPPARLNTYESRAREELGSYRPGFIDRLFGGAKRTIASLEEQVVLGQENDGRAHQEAMQQHRTSHESWQTRQNYSRRILAGDTTAYHGALSLAGGLDELAAFQLETKLAVIQPEAVVFTCNLLDDELVPREEIKLTSTGKQTTKDIPLSRYWALYQDHVCSAAIRVAREAFAVLPVTRVVVNIGPVRVNSSNGHREPVTVLAVNFIRDALDRINLRQIDPSDSMKNFSHRMKFKKTSGFEPVSPMSLDENWITT